MSARGVPLIAALIGLVVTTLSTPVRAATFIVNSVDDVAPGPCEVAIGGCTLREAIIAAVATAGRDTIAFEPTVFPPGAPATIALDALLPVIADPAGTALDGRGAGVIIGSALTGGGGPADVIVFASAPGQPLVKVAVVNVTIQDFPGSGIVICGGVRPNCEEDVAAPLVQNVVVTGHGESGVEIAGKAITEARIVDSVASRNLVAGFYIHASQSVMGTRVNGSTANDNHAPGIAITGGLGGDVIGTVVKDVIAARDGDSGVVIAGRNVTKTKLTNVAASGNGALGILVSASSGDVISTTIANTVSSGNLAGIVVNAVEALNAGTTLKDVVANRNTGSGISVFGDSIGGTKITNATAAGNGQGSGISVGGTSISGAKITRASVVNNSGGLGLTGSGHVLKQIFASDNAVYGIGLFGAGGGNTIEKSRSSGNSGAGIFVGAGSTGNVIRKNVALGNVNPDVVDENTSCDANVWEKNVFETRSEPCIQ